MTISRENLHDLIDQIPEDRLSYINDVFNRILRSELYVPKVDFQKASPVEELITSRTLEDIFRDQDV